MTGLDSGASVTLLDNGGDALTVSATGTFTFATPITAGQAYAVTVGTQPSGQYCAVTDGSGTADSAVTTVQVSCGSNEKVIYSFGATTDDGKYPEFGGPLLLHGSTLYGTTSAGGANSGGTVYQVTESGNESVLYDFDEVTMGTITMTTGALGGLVMDGSGNLYGSTVLGGGDMDGSVYQLSLSSSVWSKTQLHSFAGGTADGYTPQAGLIIDSTTGDLFGTTQDGGAYSNGEVFELTPDTTSTTGYSETVLHSFDEASGDGRTPDARLVMDSANDLFGTTAYGGTDGDGTVFELVASTSGGSTTYTEEVLHSFSGATSDGADPQGALVMDSAGDLFGTTYNGGTHSDGTVFELVATTSGGSTTYTEKVLYSFSGTDGENPQGALVMDSAGDLFGTTSSGGAYTYGTVYELVPPGSGGTTYTETVLHSFSAGTSEDGEYPKVGLVMDPTTGYLYGTTQDGGTDGDGTVYEILR